jgi:hypothetical protein
MAEFGWGTLIVEVPTCSGRLVRLRCSAKSDAGGSAGTVGAVGKSVEEAESFVESGYMPFAYCNG